MEKYNQTVSRIINLFNHNTSRYDRQEILQLFSEVRNSENVDNLALQVADTLERRVSEYDVPFCSERQAMALAYVFGDCE